MGTNRLTAFRSFVSLIGLVLFVWSSLKVDYIDLITERPGWFLDNPGGYFARDDNRLVPFLWANRRRHRVDSPVKPFVDQEYFKIHTPFGKEGNWYGLEGSPCSFELESYSLIHYSGTVRIKKVEFTGSSRGIKKGDSLIVWLSKGLDVVVPSETMKCMGFVSRNRYGQDEFISLDDQVDGLGKIWRVVPRSRSPHTTKPAMGKLVFECTRDVNSGFRIDGDIRFDFKVTSDQAQYFGVFAFGTRFWFREEGQPNCDFLLPRPACRDLQSNEARGLKITRTVKVSSSSQNCSGYCGG